LKISETTVWRAKKRLAETGTLAFNTANKGRPRKLTAVQQAHVEAILEHDHSFTYDEIQSQLQAHGINLSISTISRTRERLGYSRKNLAKRAAERDPLKRADFIARICQYSTQQLVWVDESAKDDRTCHRRHGYAKKGERARMEITFARGTRSVSTIMV
jgi:transposase